MNYYYEKGDILPFHKYWVLQMVVSQVQYFLDASWEKVDNQNLCSMNTTWEHISLFNLSI